MAKKGRSSFSSVLDSVLLVCSILIILAGFFFFKYGGITASVIGVAPAIEDTEVEPAVTAALEENGQARVIVIINDDSLSAANQKGKSPAILSAQELEAEKEKISLSQEKVLGQMDVIDSSESKAGEKELLENGQNEQYDFELKHQYETINGFSGNVTEEGLEKLQSLGVAKVYLDRKVSVALDASVPQINANNLWPININGQNITGKGETICIIDTGIDYTHGALGACDPVTFVFNGTVENLVPLVESQHPYNNNEDITYTITKPRYSSIAVHFSNISLEEQAGGIDTSDRIIVYDQNNNTLAVYKGSHADVWSPSAEGDTIYVRLVSDGSVTLDGFYIDQVINGFTNTTMDWSGCRILDGWDFVNTDNDPMDDHGHGTHVAGIVASGDSTYRGVAPEANLAAAKAMDSSGSGYISDVDAGIDWCVSNSRRLNISVISMSVGTGSTYSSYCDNYYPSTAAAVNNAVAQGIAVTIAAGNSGSSTGISAPACLGNATSVGAVSDGDSVMSYSNSAGILDLLAPGATITSANLNGGFVQMGGTSMAAPHAAGAIALLHQYWRLAYSQNITPAEAENKLKLAGKMILDGKSNIIKPRIDILGAIQLYINFTPASMANDSLIKTGEALINITSDKALSSAILEWTHSNGTMVNYSMIQAEAKSFYYQISNLSEGSHSYRVYGNDSVNTWGASSIRNLKTDFTAPAIYPADITPTMVFNDRTVVFRVNVTDLNLNASAVYLESDFSGSGENYALNWENGNVYNYTLTGLSNLSNQKNITYRFNAYDLAGNVNSSDRNNFVVQNRVPGGLNISTPENGAIVGTGDLIQFNGLAMDLDNDSLTYSWDFGDNSSSAEQTVSHAYAAAGNYLVIFSVSDQYSSNSTNITLTITASTSEPLLIFAINLAPETVHNDDDLVFKINVTGANLNTSAVFAELNYSQQLFVYAMNLESGDRYNFTFGSGNLSNQLNVSYRFRAYDTAGGMSSSANYSFVVQNRVPSNITITSPSDGSVIELGDNTVFAAWAGDADNDNLIYSWNFGDSSSAAIGASKTHAYNLTGTYVAEVNVSDPYSSNGSTVSVHVNDTKAPGITAAFNAETHLQRDSGSMVLRVTAFDYSGISNLSVWFNDTLLPFSSAYCSYPNSSAKKCSWNITFASSDAASYNITIFTVDNFSIKHTNTTIYSLNFTSCSDGIKNGNEAGTDCGGSCSACSSGENSSGSSSSGGSSSSSGGSGGGGGGSSSGGGDENNVPLTVAAVSDETSAGETESAGSESAGETVLPETVDTSSSESVQTSGPAEESAAGTESTFSKITGWFSAKMPAEMNFRVWTLLGIAVIIILLLLAYWFALREKE